MKYAFAGWMFRDGENSRCYSQCNLELSSEDKKGFASAYPRGKAARSREAARRKELLQALAQEPALEAPARQRYAAQLEVMLDE